MKLRYTDRSKADVERASKDRRYNLKESRKMGDTEKLLSRITINPEIMVGKPTIRGMRITVEQILRALSGGVSEQELIEEYSELEREDFKAVFFYATQLTT